MTNWEMEERRKKSCKNIIMTRVLSAVYFCGWKMFMKMDVTPPLFVWLDMHDSPLHTERIDIIDDVLSSFKAPSCMTTKHTIDFQVENDANLQINKTLQSDLRMPLRQEFSAFLVSSALNRRISICFLFTYSLRVIIRWSVEFLEQEEEHDSVHANPPDECFGIIAINEQ